MTTLQVIDIDGSLAIVLPNEAVTRLHVAAGDDIHLSETPDGYEILSEFTRQLKAGRRIMAENREVLSKLAKS